MRPARFVPGATPTEAIIDNLVYCLNCMLENERSNNEGVAFLAYMNTWKVENFSFDYCYQFMQVLQGVTIPVRVRLFLIVNPPSFFGSVWTFMKPMLSRDFRKKVKMIKESDLSKYLQKGFEKFLPDETSIGKADTNELVKDFIAMRKLIE